MSPQSVPARSRFSLYLDLIRWDRPAGWLVCLWPTLSALWIAADGFPGWHLLAVFVLGTFLMRSAGCCVNVSRRASPYQLPVSEPWPTIWTNSSALR